MSLVPIPNPFYWLCHTTDSNQMACLAAVSMTTKLGAPQRETQFGSAWWNVCVRVHAFTLHHLHHHLHSQNKFGNGQQEHILLRDGIKVSMPVYFYLLLFNWPVQVTMATACEQSSHHEWSPLLPPTHDSLSLPLPLPLSLSMVHHVCVQRAAPRRPLWVSVVEVVLMLLVYSYTANDG